MGDLPAWRVPIHPSHRLALVGEAPGPGFKPGMDPNQWALYPYPERSAAGRLKDMLGWTRSEYLSVFARANLLGEYPGPTFPLSRGRLAAEGVAQKLAPRPLLLMGRGVADSFGFPTRDILTWESYLLGSTLIVAAVVPHPSGLNRFYNQPGNRERVRAWLQAQCEEHGCFQDQGG